MALRHLFVALTCCFLAALSSPTNATSMAPNPKLSDLAGIWVGPSYDVYVRLELNKQGTGLLIVGEARDTFSIYRVTSTQLNDYSVNFVLQPVGEAEPMALAGTTAGYDMRLVRRGVGDASWSHKVDLESEETLLEDLESVRKASERFHSAKML